MQQTKRAFTLIELLVVIAIIGTISAVVLSAIEYARAKGFDASVRANMDSARAQAALFYDVNMARYVGTSGSSDDLCIEGAVVGTDAVKGIHHLLFAGARAVNIGTVSHNVVGGAGIAACNSTADAWAAQIPLKTSGFYCIDSVGTATTSATNRLTTSGTVTYS